MEAYVMKFLDDRGNLIEGEFLLVTPEMAAEWLQCNISKNRTIKNSQLDRVSRAINERRFFFNGDTIKFNLNGEMIDGQHRCRAIVRTGIPTWLFVFRGLSEDALPLIDTNCCGRNINDILQTTDRKIKYPLQSIAAQRILLDGDHALGAASLTADVLADKVWENREKLQRWASWAMQKQDVALNDGCVISQNHPSGKGRTKKKSAVSPSPLAALCILMEDAGVEERLIHQFWDATISGLVLHDETLYHTAVPLKRYLTETSPLVRDGGTQLPALFRNYDTVIRTYNKWRLQTPTKQVRAAMNGEWIKWTKDIEKPVLT